MVLGRNDSLLLPKGYLQNKLKKNTMVMSVTRGEPLMLKLANPILEEKTKQRVWEKETVSVLEGCTVIWIIS